MIHPTLDLVLSIVVPGAGLAIVAVGTYRLLREAVRHFSDRPAVPDPRIERIAAMSVRAAEAECRELLHGTTFDVRQDPLLARHRALLAPLPPVTRAFFSDYADVSGADVRLSRELIAPWPNDASFTRIGSDVDDVVVVGSDDRVFVLDPRGGLPEAAPEFRSVWHYLLEIPLHEN